MKTSARVLSSIHSLTEIELAQIILQGSVTSGTVGAKMAGWFFTTYQLSFGSIMNNTALLFLLSSILFFCEAQWFFQTSGTSQALSSVHFIDADKGIVVGYNGTILGTTNGGATWTPQVSGTSYNLFGTFGLDEDTAFAVGDAGTILKTTDGGTTWIPQSSGITTDLYEVYFADGNNGIAVGERFILRTTNGGITWTQQVISSFIFHSIFFIDANSAVVVGEGGVIFKTSDGGVTWTQQSSGSYNYFCDVYFSDANTGVAVDWFSTGPNPPFYKITRTTNGGAAWDVQTSGYGSLHGVSFADANTGYAVGYSLTSNQGLIFKTTDGGITWTQQSSGTSNALYSVCFTDLNTGTAVGWGGTILRTNNGGVPVELTSFKAVAVNNSVSLSWSTSTELNNRGFEIERKNNGSWRTLAFVSGHGTTSETHNYTYWDNLSDLEGVSSIWYRLKQFDYDGSFEYSKEIEVTLTFFSDYSLAQNYPNPFNPSTTINYSIPAQGKVRLIVYDALGREVSKLVDEEKAAGKYDIEFYADGLAGGIYLYRLQAGSFIETKKLILLK